MKNKNMQITPDWKRSKDEMWLDTLNKMNDQGQYNIQENSLLKCIKPSKNIILKKKAIIFSVAASLLLLLTLTSFFKTSEHVSINGEYQIVTLPDGSIAELNAGSKISYKPLWWYIEREVKLEGEGYFEVKKGEKFTVKTKLGSVRVLGTKFNVKSRLEEFAVTCLSGKVAVNSQNQNLILTPQMHSELVANKLKLSTDKQANDIIAWRYGNFYFKDYPLNKVLAEIERQYDIKIVSTENLNYLYSGKFSKEMDPQDILNIIEKTFGIDLEIR